MRATSLTFLVAVTKLSAASYVLKDDYQPSNFFDGFEFFDGADPSNAYVTYVDQNTAVKDGLASDKNDFVYLGVDHTNIATGSGRKSVRLETRKTYKHGLIVADISHMPGGICGTWPAFWTTGASWPDDGEFDIIEGVNTQKQNVVALHSTKGCQIENNGKFTGSLVTTDCDVYSPNQPSNQGCLFQDTSSKGWGPDFNSIGGGVYAMEWKSDAVSVWFFPRSYIPANINGVNPDPSVWGKPVAHFTGCDFDKFFKEQRIIFNTAFCGDWARVTWPEYDTCSAKADTCEDYVKNNPKDFKEAYWSINYLRVFQNQPGGSSSTRASASNTRQSTSTIVSTTASTTQSNTSGTSGIYPSEPSASYPTDVNPTEPSASYPTDAYPTGPSASQPTDGYPTEPSTPYPTDGYPTDSSASSSYDATNILSCTPPPTESCVTYTTKTTIAIVYTPSAAPKEAIVPIEPAPAKYPTNENPADDEHPTDEYSADGYPTNDKYRAVKRKEHINQHAARHHHG
ncbi:uncharacterized protein PADG_07819 [Paracoccidioides brasiliensis Pb18]|uniref:endo-1,3(4)-beta-glucanase n=1 Tax=Paracoccidioides brasiliensis (strain Pb18) TaxID=502780 RepID=C1GKN3_PARBD|nr:uncharacterized protein PADG_07819 [Paracoccidioides brasiliensis Pb18]EEH42999.2 hypothetical protein PADG_07819 [Paracoccidioides brasiliensis Pb18]